MEKIERGTIVEVEVPNVEKPIKAVVLDAIATGDYEGDFSTITYYTYILYAQKRLLKASNKCRRGTYTSITEEGEPIEDMFEDWSDFICDDIIVDYCEIPEISQELGI